MSFYSIALFLHVVSAVGFFVALSLEWTGQRHLQRSITLEQARTWLPSVTGAGRIGGASMIVAVLSGFSMTRAAWHHVAWIEVTVGTLVAIIAGGLMITGPRLRAIARAIAAESGDPGSVLADPMLALSLHTRAAMTVGIVFLMTVKPDMGASLLAIAAATVIGVVSAAPVIRTQRSARLEAGGQS